MNPLAPLTPEQATGVDPAAHAWVSASAGAGKTQLLTARMLRLLIGGAPPERLVALTFTKAAAAEMQNRLFARLAWWAGCSDAALAADLAAIGAPAASAPRARTLFAAALDAPGGLEVRTLHAYAQALVAAFPVEAGVDPGFALIDDRASAALRLDALDTVAQSGDAALIADLGELSIRHGEGRLDRVAATLLAHADALVALGPPARFEARLRALLDLPLDGSAEAVLGQRLAHGVFECADLRRLMAALAEAGAEGAARAAGIAEWLDCDTEGRCTRFERLAQAFLTAEGKLRQRLVYKAMHGAMHDCEAVAATLAQTVQALVDLKNRLELARVAALHLRVGRALAEAAARAKAAAGVLDFGDVIVRAAVILSAPGRGDWVRHKLDRATDHILVDEAQDTNAAQWAIVRAIADEFFAGAGARDRPRTLFAVGDHKQSIFGFQGADPAVFGAERDALARRGATVADVPLSRNFRSLPAILDVVDRVLADAGPEALGLAAAVPAHVAHRTGPGQVLLWPAVADDRHATPDADPENDDDDHGDERGWISSAERTMAARLAARVRGWLDQPLILAARGRAVRPEDILILVRKRRELVPVLVAALQQAGVPVAGADRLALTGSLAVRDMMSLMRFALQPDDDLSLAEILVSPLVGWTHDRLLALAHGRASTLWRALRDDPAPDADTARGWLAGVLALADYAAPSRFLETLLSAHGARAGLLARLGPAARDPLDALVAEAHAWEARAPASLRGFVQWLAASDIALKRDPDAPRDEVRIMTVHGAKGLQAPLVVIADAAMADGVDRALSVTMAIDGLDVPIFHGGKAGKLGPVGEACAAAAAHAAEEELRLLYVAITRAEDMLCVGGALARRDTVPPPASWHARIGAALGGLGAVVSHDGAFPGDTLRHAPAARRIAAIAAPRVVATAVRAALPAWATAPPAAEARPPRPLAPSRLAGDGAAAPPVGTSAAARRGRLLHLLFERLPDRDAADRAAFADALVAAHAPDLDPAARRALVEAADAVLDDPVFADLFAPGSIAEAPFAARVGDRIVAGKVDRLRVGDRRVSVVDYKTGARAPTGPAGVPPAHVAQMAAYAAALGHIFPGREIAAGLLYTAAPRLIWLAPAQLAAALAAAGA